MTKKQEENTPPIRNYTEDVYNYHTRVWDKKEKKYISLYRRDEKTTLQYQDEKTKKWVAVPEEYSEDKKWNSCYNTHFYCT